MRGGWIASPPTPLPLGRGEWKGLVCGTREWSRRDRAPTGRRPYRVCARMGFGRRVGMWGTRGLSTPPAGSGRDDGLCAEGTFRGVRWQRMVKPPAIRARLDMGALPCLESGRCLGTRNPPVGGMATNSKPDPSDQFGDGPLFIRQTINNSTNREWSGVGAPGFFFCPAQIRSNWRQSSSARNAIRRESSDSDHPPSSPWPERS